MSSSSELGAIRTQRGSSNLSLKSSKPCLFFSICFWYSLLLGYFYIDTDYLLTLPADHLATNAILFIYIYIYISNQVWPRQFLSTLNKIVFFVSSFSKRALCVGTGLSSAGGAVSKADLSWMTVCLYHGDSAACCQGIHCPPRVNTPVFTVLIQLYFQTQSSYWIIFSSILLLWFSITSWFSPLTAGRDQILSATSLPHYLCYWLKVAAKHL